MRMWTIQPRFMCRQHLLGEHKEIHMLAGCLKKGKTLKGYYEKKLVDPASMHKRHEELAIEMQSRGYNHKSILPSLSGIHLPKIELNPAENLLDLLSRCNKCG